MTVQFRSKSIKFQIVVLFIGCMSIVTVIAGLFTALSIRSNYADFAQESAAKIVSARADEIGRLLEGFTNEVATISQRVVIRSGDWNIIKPDLVSRQKEINKYFAMIFFADLTGNYFTSQGKGGSVADRDYFKQALVENRVIISQPIMSKSMGIPIVSIVANVKKAKGEKVGVVAATVTLEQFSRIAEKVKLTPNSFGWILNSEGTVIAHPDPSLALKKVDEAVYPNQPDMVTALFAAEEGCLNNVTNQAKAQERLFHKTIPGTPGWKMVMVLPEKDMTQKVRSLAFSSIFSHFIISILLTVITGFAIGISISKTVLQSVQGLSAGAEQVAQSSRQMSQTSQQISEGASEQAASLEEISSSLEELSSRVQQNADKSKETKGVMDKTVALVTAGQEAIQRLNSVIEEIKKSSNASAAIVKSINEIAFQTNLLALNAAVEAARAGEAGLCFAVVAGEVRSLSVRSSEAVQNATSLIEKSKQSAEKGVAGASEAVLALTEITESAKQAGLLVADIAIASEEQAHGIEQITTSVGQMDGITQSNVASAEESAAASQELSTQATELQQTIATLLRLAK